MKQVADLHVCVCEHTDVPLHLSFIKWHSPRVRQRLFVIKLSGAAIQFSDTKWSEISWRVCETVCLSSEQGFEFHSFYKFI